MTQTADYLRGQYDAYRRLLTSPRMNRPQREMIEGLALDARDELKALGLLEVADDHA